MSGIVKQQIDYLLKRKAQLTAVQRKAVTLANLYASSNEPEKGLAYAGRIGRLFAKVYEAKAAGK